MTNNYRTTNRPVPATIDAAYLMREAEKQRKREKDYRVRESLRRAQKERAMKIFKKRITFVTFCTTMNISFVACFLLIAKLTISVWDLSIGYVFGINFIFSLVACMLLIGLTELAKEIIFRD